jgi:hypothetical protein
MTGRASSKYIHTMISGVVLAALVHIPAFAQTGEQAGRQTDTHSEKVTVMLRSGERVSGQLEDLARGELFVRVSLHDQRRLQLNDVAVIDFVGGASGLPETELRDARGDDHLLVRRDSKHVQGRLVDIQGGPGSAQPEEKRMFVFRTRTGEEQRVPVSEVGRVYLGRYPAATETTQATPTAPGQTAQAPAETLKVRVPANQQWVEAGVQVSQGQQVSFEATGEVRLSNDPKDVARPAGSVTQRRAAGAPLPTELAGALIGRVGRFGTPFGIGDQAGPISMPDDGLLFLGVNDDNLGDNQGAFEVTVRVAPTAGTASVP